MVVFRSPFRATVGWSFILLITICQSGWISSRAEKLSESANRTRCLPNYLKSKLPVRVYRFPCHSSTRSAFGGTGWLTIGEASLCFDPLSSQGLFHALYTGISGAEAVVQSLNGNHDAIWMYEHQLRSIEQAYERNLLYYYSMEHRWPEQVFWRRRCIGNSKATSRGKQPTPVRRAEPEISRTPSR